MENDHQHRDSLKAEFNNDPAAFLRRFVKAFKARPGRCRPTTSSLKDMIDFIVEFEGSRQTDLKEDRVSAFEKTDFLLAEHHSGVC